MADYYRDKDGRLKKKEEPVKYKYVRDESGKLVRTVDNETDKRTFFKKGGNPLTSIGTTIGDMGLGVLQGAGNLVEGVVDLGMYGVVGASKLVGADSFADDVKNIAKKNTVDSAFDRLRDWAFEDSYLGERSVDVAKGVGYTAGMILTGGAAQAAGVGSAGVSALSTGTMFASSAGSGMSEAYQAGASDKEAVAYGAMKGAVDAGSELLFGGLGKAVNALGISRGISSLDDIVAKKLSSKISNKTFQLLTQYGVKASAEGFEEVLAGIGSAAAKKMTYMSDEDLKQLIKDEDLMDQFVIGAISSGIMQGGDVVRSVVTGTDFITGLTGNEERVIKKEVENRISEREADGTKLSTKEKNKIQEQVRSDLEKGYISIDTIESALGGEAYENYIAATQQETALRKEYEELGKKQNATLEEQARYTKLEQQMEELKTGARSSKLKEQLGLEVEEIAKQDRLGESYNEKSRRSQTFAADLTKYNEKQQETVRRAAESGILNNTNRTHEFVDMLAKISADKGVSFDFTNNQKLKESGFALEGKTVNGFLKEGNISLNIESAKALNSVVGHEITHVLEGTELYGELQQAVKVYAESKGEYGKRLEELQKLYAGVEGVNIENELTADIIGDYLFTDSDFVNRLSTEKPGLFRKIYEEIKYLLKSAITGSKQERELEKVKRTFEKAYKESGATGSGTHYSLGTTIDGRFVAVIDNDILSGIDTTVWDKAKKEEAKKAASDALKKFSGGIVVDGVTRKVNRTSRREYTRSKYTEWLYHNTPDVFADKMRAAEVAEDIVVATTNWNRDGRLNHPRNDDFVDFDHGTTLILSGNTKYIAEVVVGITDDGEAVYYDVVDMTPTAFDMKKESPTTATTQNAIGDIKGDSLLDSVSEKAGIVNTDDKNLEGEYIEQKKDTISQENKNVKYSVSDSDGRQLSEGQREYFKESKVRDENGNLKVMYHGTPDASFTVFDPNRSDDGRSLFFTDSVTVAKSYSGTRETFSPYENSDGNKAKNYKVYLNLKNPLIIDAQGDNWNSILFPKEFRDDIIEYIGERIVSTNTRTYSRYAYDRGYDGLIIKNVRDSGHYANEHEKWATSTVAIAFSPEQVKSVDNQNPTSDKDIRRSLGEDIGPVGNLNVRGKDIALEEIAPVQQSIPISDEIGPVGKTAGEPLKDIGPVRDDIVSQEIQTTEENVPVGQEYSPDELPTWGDVKKTEVDTYTPEPESYPKKKVTTVKERNAAKLQSLKVQLKNEQDIMEKSHASYNAEIRDLQSLYDSKKNKNTRAAQELLDRIERRKNSRDNTDAFYEKRINDIKTKIGKMNTKEFKIVEQRMSKEEEYQQTLGELIGDTSTWIDKKMGIYYKVNTLRRNLRDIVRDENGNRDIAKTDAIYDELQGKYNHNEAKLNREANEIRGRYAELKITAEEDAYIQMLGEYRHNPDTTLTADVMKKYYEKHKKKIDTKKVDKIIASARQLYDELFRRVNATLEEQGMRPIEYREGYFPHFTDDKQSWLAKLLNWKTRKDEIPTDIAGLTEQFKPVRSWQSFDKHRTGDSTDYSFKKGLDMYVQGALDWIYHIEDIQKRRAFENEIRYRHSDQGVKDKVEAIRNNPEYDASEVQDQIDLIYKEARNPLNNFISDFRTQTNTLAGKKSSMDRGTEEWTNRKFYSTVSNISNRVTANMVVGSFSSALTNFIPITQSWAEVSPVSSLLAMRDTIKSYVKDDGVVEKSDFLTNRLRKSKKLYQSTWDKAIDKLGGMMEAVDNFTSQVVWRSKYLENMNAGMSENEAIKNADQFAENVMAGRSRGNNPTIFDAKNPFIKIATAFQLEVNNQYGYLFKDVPQELRNEVKGKLVAGYAKVFIGAWFYNMAYSALTGRDAALDPIGIIFDVLKDFGVGGDEEPEEPAEIIGNLAESVAEELPFIGGLLGGGRIPISSALPYDDSDGFVGAIKDLSDDVANWKDGGRENFLKEMANPASYLLLPAGGGQAKKTIQGLGMFSDKHPIAGSYTNSGKLRFSVEDTPLSRLQAALFGQWSSQNAREYIEEGRSPLGEKQTQELVDTGLPMADYWKYRDGLKEQSGTQEKIEYIAGLDLPIDTKNILVNNAVDRKTPVDLTEYDNLSGYEEFDFFTKNKELYNFLQENGVSYWDYKILGEKVQSEYKALQKDTRKQRFLQENGVSVSTYCSFSEWEKDAYDWAYKNPEKYQLSQVITKDVVEYKHFTAAINNLTSDKDANGKTISGSKKKKVERYINNLNIDYGQKLILFRSLYESDDTYNYEIVEYLNGRDDISRAEMESILKSLGFTVYPDGTVKW
ncbi:MAG: hypothetical protein PUC73_11280 [Lachnospiraceae bacterium]|nr:hypothetical protein [Lachnospiraceae bacterium]